MCDMIFSKSRPLFEAANDISINGYGLYVIMMRPRRPAMSEVEFPYYVGKAVGKKKDDQVTARKVPKEVRKVSVKDGIRSRLHTHCANLLGGAFTMWSVDETRDEGVTGVAEKKNVIRLENRLHYAPFPDEPDFHFPHTLEDFCNEQYKLRDLAYKWATDRLYVRYLIASVTRPSTLLRQQIAKAESRLIVRLSGQYLLANGDRGKSPKCEECPDLTKAVDSFGLESAS